MKVLLPFLISSFFVYGCSHQNAFTKFELLQQEEAALASIQSTQLTHESEVAGVASVVYLNEVDPQSYHTQEHFLLCIYLKKRKKIQDLDITLNNKKPLKIEEISATENVTRLSGTQNEWSSYYLVDFEKQNKKRLSLLLKDGDFSSQNIIFTKDAE